VFRQVTPPGTGQPPQRSNIRLPRTTCAEIGANNGPGNLWPILDSRKSQCVVWAGQLDPGGLAWTRKAA
jgi:hypothetical protein